MAGCSPAISLGDTSLTRGKRYDVGFYVPWMTPLVTADAGQHWSGGAETQVMLLSRALAKRGLSVCLVVFDLPGAVIPASSHGVDILIRPPWLAGGRLTGRFREIVAMRAALRRVDAKVVVTRTAGANVGLVGLWTKLSRRRFVYSSASLIDFAYESLLAKLRDRLLFRLGVALADMIIVQTEEQVRLCERRFGKTPTLIRSVSEPAEQSQCEPEAFLWVGRIDANKQPLEFLELARSLPEAAFWMVASPLPTPEGRQLWDEIERAALGLSNFTLLAPRRRPDLLKMMERAVAVVSTSEFEGMPNIFLEGWGRGIPALAFAHDPDGVITRYGLGGFAQGQRERLVELASDLWHGRTARNECATRCRAYAVSVHSPEAVSAEWERVLQAASDGSRPLLVEAG
jgi:glycosyltransferase involved in cell wall biosynthesis